MKAHTISDAFRACIGEREVTSAFFTTYSFEPDFFEQEVIPLLLGDQALSSQIDIRSVQLQALMQDKGRRFAVVHDVDVFNPTAGSRLDVDYLPVRIGRGCQHAKMAILVLQEKVGQTPTILLVAGSFNLTRAGWWENIEVGHFVELQATRAPANILEPMRRALRFFQAVAPTPVLDEIINVQAQWSASADDPDCSFYFSGAASGRLAFLDFIGQHPHTLPAAKGAATLEIVSPFFGEKPDSGDTQKLMSLFSTVRLLLPRDEDKRALVDPGVFKTFHTGQWCGWASAWHDSHEVIGAPFRRVHAKIFQGRGKRSWQFVGSVNFSHKAFRDNVEAGFLLQGSNFTSLLEPLTALPSEFAPGSDLHSAEASEGLAMPVLRLAYDWDSQWLEVTAQDSISGELTLLDNPTPSLGSIVFAQTTSRTQLLPTLRDHLERSSLVRVRWQSGAECVERYLMVSQRNIYSRPSQMPAMDLQSLLRLFIEMRLSKKISQFGELAQLMLNMRAAPGTADEQLPEMVDAGEAKSFFAEFSQVNGAFWQLERSLALAADENNAKKLAYYLAGCQPDSLKALLESVEKGGGDEETVVVRYLTLLSMHGLLTRYPQHSCATLTRRVQALITELENDELLRHLDEAEGTRFLDWFRTQFQRPLTAANSRKKDVPHAADQ
ncbi:hypothetical protein [Pseudomonas sp. GM55]|uniref:hypothetical protein n=1 Tax=Pseudomonas sp. GM55 TaxID=1144333 RepID=UPI000270A6BC|nr:hypothetical protein [Pseudomonas sp. GM55]EJM77187.1 hypothetical protein PMI31_00801 [Pseudomonas sp. GM55]